MSKIIFITALLCSSVTWASLRMLDPKVDPHPGVIFEVSSDLGVQALPSSMDWRSHQGKNWMSPIRDQGRCGSCVAFAATGTLESQLKISKGQSQFSLTLSPQFLFSCGGGVCNVGWYQDKASDFLKSTGVVVESCMPYSSTGGKDVACSKSCSLASQKFVKISSYSKPTKSAIDLNALKSALQKGPLMTSMSVYADFMNHRQGIYKHKTGKYLGGHAVVIIGYNDAERYFIIRNSWGTSWGEKGYGRISYDDISGIGGRTWKYEVSPSAALWSQFEDLKATPLVEENFLELQQLVQGQFQVQEHSDIFEVELRAKDFAGFSELYLMKARDGQSPEKIAVSFAGNVIRVKVNPKAFSEGLWHLWFEGVEASRSRSSRVSEALSFQVF